MRFERPILPEHVKAEAARRIEARYPVWRQVNVLREGGADEMGVFIDQVRAASNALEARKPIPPDFRNDRHWPE
jgi:hypothetical protein